MGNFGQIIEKLGDWGAWSSVVAAILGLVTSIVATWLSFRVKSSSQLSEGAKLEEITRIDEVREARDRNESIARWSNRSNSLLTITQVVIGGVLATSFVQTTMDKDKVGFLGVLVLVSSLVHQQFRPDLKYRGARRRVMKLTHLLREAENGAFEIEQKKQDAPTIEALRRYVTTQLSRIEELELDDMPGERRDEVRNISTNPVDARADSRPET